MRQPSTSRAPAPLLLIGAALVIITLPAACDGDRPDARSELERRQGSISRQLDRIAEEMEEEARRERFSYVVEVDDAGPDASLAAAELARTMAIESGEAEALLSGAPVVVAEGLDADEAEALRRRLAAAGAAARAYSTYSPPEDDL